MTSSSSKDYRRGIVAMSLAMAMFLSNDSMMKLLTSRAAPDQLLFFRSFFVALFILIWLVAKQAWAFRFLAHPRMIRAGWRGVLDAASSLSFLGALTHMPLPNATAINLSGPLMLTALAVLVLGEKVTWRQWAAILVGMGGVAMIIQPSGDAFNWFSLLALLGTFCTAVRDAVTRSIGMEIPALLLTLMTGVATAAICGLSGAWRGWPPISTADVLVLAFASLFIIAGQQFTIRALRIAEASVVAPFRYTSILWSLIFGYVFWSYVPNLLACAGIAVVVSSGLYLLHRERLRRRLADAAAALV